MAAWFPSRLPGRQGAARMTKTNAKGQRIASRLEYEKATKGIETTVICCHSYRFGNWGSSPEKLFVHEPTGYHGGVWLCDKCRNSIPIPQEEVDKAVFTDFAVGINILLAQKKIPYRPQFSSIPDFTKYKTSVWSGWDISLVSETRLVYG
jgi:hypothetical protein